MKLKDEQPKVQDVVAPEAKPEESAEVHTGGTEAAPVEEAKPEDSAAPDFSNGEDTPATDDAPAEPEDEKSEEEEV
jgi:hypothetical protein